MSDEYFMSEEWNKFANDMYVSTVLYVDPLMHAKLHPWFRDDCKLCAKIKENS